ncbi:MAG TPA: SDR family NAD(P)-dependent oxidoreductase [Devosia sp.]|nr:SDR family NAD(P)-dependent oxidoreductase [Devosia sp.]
MLIDLKGKVAIVTGSGRGIGRTIARRLADEGCSTIVTDVRQDLLDDVAADGWSAMQLICDVRSVEQARGTAAAVLERFGRIDILVNNAGVAGGGPAETLAEDVWDLNLDVNLKGIMLMCQTVIPAMKAQRGGRILNASSFAAIIPALGSAAYAASKAGVISLTRVLAGELGPHDITVNCYAPGMIPTEMNHFAEREADVQERLLDTLTLRRWGRAEEIADLICFLASDKASYITGAMIEVSGGKFATQMPWAAYRAF